LIAINQFLATLFDGHSSVADENKQTGHLGKMRRIVLN